MLPGGLTHGEVEKAVESLAPTAPEDVGTAKWKTQRKNVELFNIISHRAAQRKADDFVLSALVSHDKMPVLVHELCLAEAMRRKVYSNVLGELAATPAGVYLYLNYEGVLINLLECLCYHEEAVTGMGDAVLDLIDYCWRSVTSQFLSGENGGGAGGGRNNVHGDYDPALMEDARKVAEMSAEERVHVQVREGMITRSLGCVSLLWFVVERMSSLPLAAVNTILNKHDLLVGFAALLELQPWQIQRGAGGKDAFKFKNGKFERVAPTDLPLVCAAEAHVWFALHFMLCDRDCRAKYTYNRFRKEQLLRVKRFLNEVLVDQLPALVDVQRAMEELSFMEPPAGTEEKFKAKMLLIDHVSPLQAALDGYKDWGKCVAAFKTALTRDPDNVRSDAQCVAQIIDLMELDGEGAASV